MPNPALAIKAHLQKSEAAPHQTIWINQACHERQSHNEQSAQEKGCGKRDIHHPKPYLSYSLTPRLLIRPTRLPQESWQHYLMRVAEENGIEGIPSLSRALGLTTRQLVGLDEYSLMQFLRGVALSDLRRTSSPIQTSHNPEIRSRICPACITEGTPVQAYMDEPLTLRCDRHSLLLVDQCPTCHKPLTYRRRLRVFCDCGFSLAETPSIPANASVDWFYSIFAPWRLNSIRTEEMAQDALAELASARLVKQLISLRSKHSNVKSRTASWIDSSDWEWLQTLTIPWPGKILSLLGPAIAQLSYSQRWTLKKRLSNKHLPMLASVAANLCTRRSTKTLSRVPNHRNIEGRQMRSLHHLRKIAKLDAAAAQALFTSGFFNGTQVFQSDGGKVHLICTAEIEALESWFKQTVDKKEAMHVLGCSMDTLGALVRLGKLKAEFLPAKPRSPRFTRTNLDAFISHLRSLASADTPTGRIVSLGDLSPISPSGKSYRKSWQALVKEIFDGQIPIYTLKTGYGWHSYAVSPEALEQLGFPSATT